MPAVDDAMRRSLGPLGAGVAGAVSGSLGWTVERRDAIQDATNAVTDFKTALSSWDNCMSVTYCKWPLIAIIIVGGLLIFSILSCIIRRICCGLSCCCSCFSCLKCCGNCCGCCDSPADRRKYPDNPYMPTSSRDGGFDHGYKPPPPMMFPAASGAIRQPHGGAPQYAEFDAKRSDGEDSLPAMPSWENSASKQVLVEHESVEMDQLKKPEPEPEPESEPEPHPPPQQPAMALMAGVNTGRSTPATRGPSPVDAYGRPLDHRIPGANYGRQAPPGYPGPYSDPYAAAAIGPYGSLSYDDRDAGYAPSQYAPSMSTGIIDQYGQTMPNPGYGPGPRSHSPYGMQRPGPYADEYHQYGGGGGGGGAVGPGPGARQGRSPGPDYGGGYGRSGYNAGFPDDYDDDDDFNYQRRPAPRPVPSRGFSGDPAGPLVDLRTAAVTDGRYGSPSPTSPPPRAQYAGAPPYSASPAAMRNPPRHNGSGSPPVSPTQLVNNSGFDFNSGFSRPLTPREAQPFAPDGPSPRPPLPLSIDDGRQPTLPRLDFDPSGGSANEFTPYRRNRDELHGA